MDSSVEKQRNDTKSEKASANLLKLHLQRNLLLAHVAPELDALQGDLGEGVAHSVHGDL